MLRNNKAYNYILTPWFFFFFFFFPLKKGWTSCVFIFLWALGTWRPRAFKTGPLGRGWGLYTWPPQPIPLSPPAPDSIKVVGTEQVLCHQHQKGKKNSSVKRKSVLTAEWSQHSDWRGVSREAGWGNSHGGALRLQLRSSFLVLLPLLPPFLSSSSEWNRNGPGWGGEEGQRMFRGGLLL